MHMAERGISLLENPALISSSGSCGKLDKPIPMVQNVSQFSRCRGSSDTKIGAIIRRRSRLTLLVVRHPVVQEDRFVPANRHRRDYGCCACHHDTANGASVRDLKSAVHVALEGVNRGIFGVTSKKKVEIEGLLKSLEALNPCPRPTDNLETVKGEWRLLYSTISILGVKRTKLGLRDFITFGDFLQIIDVEKNRAVNKIGFSVVGLGMLKGALTIEASYSVISPTRVDIQFKTSSISPDRLLSLFKKNYNLLLGIFNPDGWLEITYVDDTLRIGRDDKGNVFLVERT